MIFSAPAVDRRALLAAATSFTMTPWGAASAPARPRAPIYSRAAVQDFASKLRAGQGAKLARLGDLDLTEMLAQGLRPSASGLDDTSAIEDALRRCAKSGRPLVLDRVYQIERPLFVGVAKPFVMLGTPGVRCGLDLKHELPAESLHIRADSPVPVTLSGFFVGRAQPTLFRGQRLVRVTGAAPLIMDSVELYGSCGMSFLGEFIDGGVISRCHVHDNLGGEPHRSGTDGLHLYKGCRDVLVADNLVERVGDDAISFGSYLGTAPNTGSVCVGNRISHVAGSIKVYGAASGLSIFRNTAEAAFNGGVTLWDDRDAAQSFDISDIVIAENRIEACGGPSLSGGVYLAMTKGDGTGRMRDIVIRDNLIKRCTFGVSLASSVPNKRFGRISISGNLIEAPTRAVALVLRGAGGPVTIAGNTVKHGLLTMPLMSSPALELSLRGNNATI